MTIDKDRIYAERESNRNTIGGRNASDKNRVDVFPRTVFGAPLRRNNA